MRLHRTHLHRGRAEALGVVLALTVFALAAFGDDGKDLASMQWLIASLCGLFLLAVVVVSSWYFGKEGTPKRPVLLGAALLSAACGIGIGYSTEHTFATVIPILAAAYGGALVCAVSYHPSHQLRGKTLANFSAVSGIPLMLGAYFAESIRHFWLWYPDPRRAVVAILILAFTVGLAVVMGKIRSRAGDSHERTAALVLAGASFGAFIGLVTGLSSQPVVTYVAPASLALFAGSVSCFFAAAGSAENDGEEERIATVLFGFGALLIVGLLLGSIVRMRLGWDAAAPASFAALTLVLATGAMGLRPWKLERADAGDSVKILGFAFLGAGIGLPVGMSQTFVLHVVIPTALAVFAGLAGYVFISDSTHRRRFLVLLAIFGATALLGGFVGNTLKQDADLPIYLADRTVPVDTPGSTPEDQESIPASMFADIEDHIAQMLWSIEGEHEVSAVMVRVSSDWTGEIRIRDRVADAIRYEQVPSYDAPATAYGESLEIRWPVSAGLEALRISGWRRLIEYDGELRAEGSPETIDTTQARREEQWYVLVYPK